MAHGSQKNCEDERAPLNNEQLTFLSGRRELDPLPSPWQGDVLPMNYTRFKRDRHVIYADFALSITGISYKYMCRD